MASVAPTLLEIPPELLDRILSLLDPVDLLVCSRTCKVLRERIFNRSSGEVLWTAVFAEAESLSLFKRPSHISPPRFTSLLFDKLCLSCGRADNAPETIWPAATRLCGLCIKRQAQTLATLTASKDEDCRVRHLVPTWKTHRAVGELKPGAHRQVVLRRQVIEVRKSLGPMSGDWLKRFRQQLELFRQRQAELALVGAKVAAWLQGWDSRQSKWALDQAWAQTLVDYARQLGFKRPELLQRIRCIGLHRSPHPLLPAQLAILRSDIEQRHAELLEAAEEDEKEELKCAQRSAVEDMWDELVEALPMSFQDQGPLPTIEYVLEQIPFGMIASKIDAGQQLLDADYEFMRSEAAAGFARLIVKAFRRDCARYLLSISNGDLESSDFDDLWHDLCSVRRVFTCQCEDLEDRSAPAIFDHYCFQNAADTGYSNNAYPWAVFKSNAEDLERAHTVAFKCRIYGDVSWEEAGDLGAAFVFAPSFVLERTAAYEAALDEQTGWYTYSEIVDHVLGATADVAKFVRRQVDHDNLLATPGKVVEWHSCVCHKTFKTSNAVYVHQLRGECERYKLPTSLPPKPEDQTRFLVYADASDKGAKDYCPTMRDIVDR